MKEIKLLQLKIENFKGIRLLEIRPDGKSMSIYGDNATGKTTIYDALTWLLFDKDSRGVTKFEIKPLGVDGLPREAGVMPTVEAVLSVDGEQRKLSKAYRERWERKRGSTDKVLTGHTTDYTVDDVPHKENEYKRLITEIIDEDVFRQLTSVYYFCSTLKWQDRRKRLFDICNVQSDAALLAAAPAEFDRLRDEIGSRTVDGYKDMLTAQVRNAKRDLDGLPLRIDECNKTIADIGDVDFAALREQEAVLTQERAALQAELVKLENNTLLSEKQTALETAKNDMRQLDMDNQEHRRKCAPTADQRPAVQDEIRRLERLLSDARAMRAEKLQEVQAAEAAIADCKRQWDEIHAKAFSDDGVCKLCGQKLPQEQIAEVRENFEEMKRQYKQSVVELSDKHKENRTKAQTRIADLDAEIADYEKSLAEERARLEAMAAPETLVVADLPGYQERFAALAKQISALEAEVSTLHGETANIRKNTAEKIAALDGELGTIRGQIAQQTTMENARRRIDELHQEQRERAAYQEQLECMIDLCEDFVRYKVQSITESVNSRFDMVKFRLFTEQINGGLAECCDATVGGIPYDSLNSAAKINAGLDVIAALSQYEGVKVPLFIDNAESVTRLYGIDTQVIRLVVSEQDKELRCTA